MGFQLVEGVRNTAGARYTLYRFHIMDPIFFRKDLRITQQALGYGLGEHRYLALKDDIATLSYWYQTEPHKSFPKFPGRTQLVID